MEHFLGKIYASKAAYTDGFNAAEKLGVDGTIHNVKR